MKRKLFFSLFFFSVLALILVGCPNQQVNVEDQLVKVTFHSNALIGGKERLLAQEFITGKAKALMEEVFYRADYVFLGWSLSPNGLKEYNEGQIITISKPIDLYAIWAKERSKVTFYSNPPIDTLPETTEVQDFIYTEGRKPLTPNAFVYDNPSHQFVNWNTARDGSGIPYADNDLAQFTEDTSLYAQWLADEFVVTFNDNIPSSGATMTQNFRSTETKPLTKNTWTRDGWVYGGWNTVADYSGDHYADEQVVTMVSNLDLYAIWGREIVVQFNGNGGSGSMVNQSFIENAAQAVRANEFDPPDNSKIFAGWNTVISATAPFGPEAVLTFSVNGEGKIVVTGNDIDGNENVVETSYSVTDTVTLYAVWKQKGCYIFHSNNGNDDTVIQDYVPGSTIELTPNEFVYTDMTFMGWADWIGGVDVEDYGQVGQTGGRKFDDNATVTTDSTPQEIHLYAVWKGFKRIEAQTFTMGDANRGDDKPKHQVTLTRAFEISTNEVTQEEWHAVMGVDISEMGGGSVDAEDKLLPIALISWYQAIAYCNKLSLAQGLVPCYAIDGLEAEDWATLKLSEIPGKIIINGKTTDIPDTDAWKNVTCNFDATGYRLPTEAEWELAARGANNPDDAVQMAGLTTNTYTNNSSGFIIASDVVALFRKYANIGKTGLTEKIMKFRSNSNGLYDMSGNVHEWCWDWFEKWDSNLSAVTDPTGPTTVPASDPKRMNRGGAFSSGDNSWAARFTYRGNSKKATEAINDIGFRLCRTVVTTPPTP